MEVKLTNIKGTWNEILNRCRTTVSKKHTSKEPSTKFKEHIVRSEHSPIRSMTYSFDMEVPSYVSTHFARHHEGVEKYISTSREDRTGVPREERKQTDYVHMEMECNTQALINMSRKRLCTQADKNTREVMQMMKDEVEQVEPIVAHNMVRECVYRNGYCPEINCCGYNATKAFANELALYMHELTDQDLELLEEHQLKDLLEILENKDIELYQE